MGSTRVVVVMLRQPKSDPTESRTDPLYEFGCFGLRHAQHAAELAHQLLGLHPLPGLQVLCAFRRLVFEASGHRAFSIPLNCTGMRPMA